MEKVTNFLQTYLVEYINIWISAVLIVLFLVLSYIAIKKGREDEKR